MTPEDAARLLELAETALWVLSATALIVAFSCGAALGRQ